MPKRKAITARRPMKYRNRAQVSMYMKNALKRKLQKEAKAKGTSVSVEIQERLAKSFGGK
jgi:hypothetical protein